MLIDTRQARLRIAAGQVARLGRARCGRLTVLSGAAWITIDDDPRDIVLSAGESLVINSNANVIVSPLQRAQALELQLAGPVCKPVARSLPARLWARLRSAVTSADAPTVAVV